ncbi:indole-3-acetate O-methyltransferase 1 [Lingula anatina]|uniref:Indole-3-acetate O-methyltransferase 1 n=1 Tax=Lingula anatina TaxID=7574 RepID=A0A1S3H954_LINAN|nr:indole-3-acetate O-methyltransferase 1 [Lingula anatina]|eukprot:XP_013382006.1 indole-3-acetate O-methyltransferase 1 [Lingula anatina]
MDQQYGVPCSTAFGKQIRQSKYPVYRMLDRHHGSHFWSGNAVNYEKLYNNILPYALQAIAGSVNSTDRPFVACDFGAGDGGTSMKLMTEIIRAVRAKYGKEKPIVIVYEDLPWNDFKSLFFLTQGLFEDQRNFLPQDKNVFLLASGTNFYERCLPPNYVDLAVSCSAMHWLSKRPCNLQWDIIGQGDKVSYEELDAYKKQAAVDWETILINRAKELKIGAHIIIAIVGTKEGVHSGSTAIYKVKVIPYLRDLWLSFATAGRITKVRPFSGVYNVK